MIYILVRLVFLARSNAVALGFFLSFFLIFSCGSLAPFAEKNLAEEMIERAEKVDADTYAPDSYTSSLDDYGKGEELIVTNEKHSNNDKAKGFYLSAIKFAQSAYAKSVVYFTQKYIDQTDEQIENARLEKVDRVSPDIFLEAVDLNDDAKLELALSNYTESLKHTLEAGKLVVLAVSNTRYVRSKVDLADLGASQLMEKAVEQKAEFATPENYQQNREELERIRLQNQEALYFKSLEDYSLLIEEIEIMLQRIEDKRVLAFKEFEEASQVIEKIKNTSKEVEEEVKQLNKLDQGEIETFEDGTNE